MVFWVVLERVDFILHYIEGLSILFSYIDK